MFITSGDPDFCSEGSRTRRNYEEYYDFLCVQFHAVHKTAEFQWIMDMCQKIVFSGQTDKGKGNQMEDNASDSGESEINWGMEALALDDEDDPHELENDEWGLPDFTFNPNLDHNNQSRAGPSTYTLPPPNSFSSHDNPSSLHPPVATLTNTRPAPSQPLIPQQVPPAPKKKSRALNKTSHSGITQANLLFPLPAPATPKKSTLSVPVGLNLSTDESDSFEPMPLKKTQVSKAKQS